MLFGKYSEIYVEPIYKVCGHNPEFLMLKYVIYLVLVITVSKRIKVSLYSKDRWYLYGLRNSKWICC
jgi:hypothetical protein